MPADAYAHELRHWPLALTRAARLPNGDEIEELTAVGDELLARGEPFAWLFQIEHTRPLPDPHRVRYARWLAMRRHVLDQFCVAFCVVHPTVVGRTVDRSIFLTTRPRYPYATFRSAAGGRLWCVARLAERGLHVPGELLLEGLDDASDIEARVSAPTPALPLGALRRA